MELNDYGTTNPGFFTTNLFLFMVHLLIDLHFDSLFAFWFYEKGNDIWLANAISVLLEKLLSLLT
jgi:hypothetical protein